MNISQAEHGGNGESFVVVNQSLQSPPSRRATDASSERCCTKSSLTFEIQTMHGILWTVRACKAFGAIAGSGIKAMLEVVTAFFGVMSAGIFIAHAVDGY